MSNVFTDISENRLVTGDLKEYKDSLLTFYRQLSHVGETKQKKTLKNLQKYKR